MPKSCKHGAQIDTYKIYLGKITFRDMLRTFRNEQTWAKNFQFTRVTWAYFWTRDQTTSTRLQMMASTELAFRHDDVTQNSKMKAR